MTTTHCPNCDAPVTGQYCSNCGQIQKDIRRFFLALVNEALDDIFSLNSRTSKTLVALIFRPGFLTKQYLIGKRVSYVQPLRLYFVTSIAFFLLLSIINIVSPAPGLIINSDNGAVQQQTTKTGNANQAPAQALETVPTETKESTENQQQSDNIEGALDEIDKSFDEDEIDVNVGILSAEHNEQLKQLFRAQFKKVKQLLNEGQTNELISVFLETAPPIIFCLLPLFALLLKLHYLFRGLYYTEHLIFAVHNHSFIFLMLLINSITDFLLGGNTGIAENVSLVISIWIPVYLWLSLKRVYDQGKFFTTLKFITLLISYGVLLGIAMILTVLIGIATI
jgi:hypothetical protein